MKTERDEKMNKEELAKKILQGYQQNYGLKMASKEPRLDGEKSPAICLDCWPDTVDEPDELYGGYGCSFCGRLKYGFILK